MEIKVFRCNAALPEHLRGQILALIRIAFHDTAGDYAGPGALPEEWRPLHVVGCEGEVILSYAGVVRREIELQGEVFATYGLSSVYTFPHYRRRGLGSRIVARATAEIDRAGDGDVALLFTYEAVVPFYERCGWQAMREMRCLAGERGRPVLHEALAMMRFLSERGRRRRSAFSRGSVHIGGDSW
jgi:aminoglycoside 2'-N-acetyltransferase I